MKKVLIITYAFCEKENIGSVRSRGIAKYIGEYGWEPIILTIKSNYEPNEEFKIIETEYFNTISKIKRILGFKEEKPITEQMDTNELKKSKIANFLIFFYKIYCEIFAYPDLEKNWYNPAITAGIKLFNEEKFDAIISTSPPQTSHLIASELKNRFNIAWVADLQDLWSQNHYHNHTFIRRIFEKKLELKTLKTADIITTTTKFFEEDLKKLHEKQIHDIKIGFDPETFEFESTELNDKFTIIHTGHLYNGKRNPIPLLSALKELIDEKKINLDDLIIEFYGPEEKWLEVPIKEYGLQNHVKVCGQISKDNILLKQRKSQLLLLITWENPEDKKVIPAKIFEYIAAKRPILSIGVSEGSVKDLIEVTQTGVHISNKEEIKNQIEYYYNEFKDKGKLEYNVNESEVMKLSQKEMARKYANILNGIKNEN